MGPRTTNQNEPSFPQFMPIPSPNSQPAELDLTMQCEANWFTHTWTSCDYSVLDNCQMKVSALPLRSRLK